jgi:hypothetical protein
VVVGRAVSTGRAMTWSYAVATAVMGVVVVTIKVGLGH